VVDADTLSEAARVLCPGGRAVVVALAQLAPDTAWTQFLEWLYRLTGQRQPVPDLAAQCRALGLTEQRTWKTVGRSSVLMILLVKDWAIDKPGSIDD
jgi:ubiquinone/menaquinone biosynthesis C-methylase UbiE